MNYSKSLLVALAAIAAVSTPPHAHATDLIVVDIGGGIYELDSDTGEQSHDLFAAENPADAVHFDAMARHPTGGSLYAIIGGNRLVTYHEGTHEVTTVAVLDGVHISGLTFGINSNPPAQSTYPLYAIGNGGKIFEIAYSFSPGSTTVTDTGWTIPGHSGFAIAWRNGRIFAIGNKTYDEIGTTGRFSVPEFWFLDLINQDLINIPLNGANLQGPEGFSPNISGMVFAHSNLFYIYDDRYNTMYSVELQDIIGDVFPLSAVVSEVPFPLGGFSALAKIGDYTLNSQANTTLQGFTLGSLVSFQATGEEITRRSVPWANRNSGPSEVHQVFQSLARHPVTGEYWVIVNDRTGVTYEDDDTMVWGAIASLNVKTGQISNLRSLTEVGFRGITFGPNGQLYGVTGERSLRGPGHIVLINPGSGEVTDSPFSSYQHPGISKNNLEYNRDEMTLNHFFVDENGIQRMEKIFVSNSQTGPAVDISQNGDPISDIRGVVYGGNGIFYAVDTINIYSITTSGEVSLLSVRDGGYWAFGGLEISPDEPPLTQNISKQVLRTKMEQKITKLKKLLKTATKRKDKTKAKLLKKQISRATAALAKL